MNSVKALWDLNKENNELKKCIDFVNEEREKLQNENDLLRENIKELEHEIERIYHVMISLKSIANEEIENLEDIDVI